MHELRLLAGIIAAFILIAQPSIARDDSKNSKSSQSQNNSSSRSDQRSDRRSDTRREHIPTQRERPPESTQGPLRNPDRGSSAHRDQHPQQRSQAGDSNSNASKGGSHAGTSSSRSRNDSNSPGSQGNRSNHSDHYTEDRGQVRSPERLRNDPHAPHNIFGKRVEPLPPVDYSNRSHVQPGGATKGDLARSHVLPRDLRDNDGSSSSAPLTHSDVLQQRELQRLRTPEQYGRLNQFTPEQLAALKAQGRLEEAIRYAEKGGARPLIDTRIPNAHSPVTPQSNTPIPGGGSIANSQGTPNQQGGIGPRAPLTAGTSNTVSPFQPQPEVFGKTLRAQDVLTSEHDRRWLGNLKSDQRDYVREFSGEQLRSIQQSGQWNQFKAHVETAGTPVLASSSTATWGMPPAVGTMPPPAATGTANSTPPIAPATSPPSNQAPVYGPIAPPRDTSKPVATANPNALPTREELAALKYPELAKLPPEKLQNLDPGQAEHLRRYKAGIADQPTYDKETQYWNEKTQKMERRLDQVQAVVGVAGLVPVIGEVADLTNAGISLGRGDKASAALDVASTVPILGNGAGAANIVRRADRVSGLVPSSSNYRKVFFANNPEAPTNLEVHHSIPQKFEETLNAAGTNVHESQFLRGVDPTKHPIVTRAWAAWEKALDRVPTAQEILDFARKVENDYGEFFWKK